ncbi:serine threonine kinase [Fusarium mundagurra]|uniref:Serine threonine kinase n=1 Tax=Fusarium mundagurra TaxID=1567541 RepID=A0A8H6DDD5_9HYPO|nr:serine threonine kinase [Fusarium mundagurra]
MLHSLRTTSDIPRRSLPERALSNQKARLSIWASNIGALQSGNGALDVRLRGFSVMKRAIIQCFEQLEQVIHSSTEILQGRRLPLEQMFTEFGELWDSASDDSFDLEDKEYRKTELGQNLTEMSSILSDLFKLSFKLRNTASRSTGHPILRALSYQRMVKVGESDGSFEVDIFSLYAEFDRSYAEDLIAYWRWDSWLKASPQRLSATTSDCHEKDPDRARKLEALVVHRSLIDRWIRSITNRRRMFAYWERHAKKLAKAVGDTTAPQLAITARDPSIEIWMLKHIIQDLQPYMCTWDDCPDADTMYGTRSAWLSHEAQVHRRIFRCIDHPETFLSRDSLKNHLLSSHQELGEGQIEALMDFGQASHPESRVSCPFCLSEGPFLRGLPNHMAYHQERLACFSATRQSLDQETGLSSDTDSDRAQGDNDPDPLELLESEASSEQSSISKDSENPRKSQVQTTLSLGKIIRQALLQSSCPDEDPDPEPAISFPAPKYLPLDELNRIINYKSVSDELKRLELFKEPELSRRALEIQGEAGFNRQEELDPDQTDSRDNTLKYPTRKKIFACLVLLGKVAAITQVLDEGLSDADLPFNLDPDRVKLVKRDKIFAEPIAAFHNWMEHEAYMFYTYQWYMLAPSFILANNDEPRVTHYTMSYMIPLPFGVTETVPDSASSPVCGHLGMQKIEIHHAHHSQRNSKFFQRPNQNVFAIKLLRDIEAKEYDLRLQSLLNLAKKRHPHLLQLLLGLTHGNTRSFIFQWPDCDLEQFWASNPPGNDAINMARWISSQLFGLADALQLIRDLFPSGVLAENDHRLQPPHRDLSPERILCFQTKEITQCVLKIADFGSMQYHDDQAHHQRGSETCIDSAYRAPELLAGGMAPNSDLWSLGCIILHFIVWYHGGWSLVSSLSAASCAEEEGLGVCSDDDKFFKYGNLNMASLSLDPQGLAEGGAGGAVIGQDQDVPNTAVLKESIKQDTFKLKEQKPSLVNIRFGKFIFNETDCFHLPVSQPRTKIQDQWLRACIITVNLKRASVYTRPMMCSNVEHDDTKSPLHTLLWERKARHSDPRLQFHWPYELLIILMTPDLVYSELISASVKERNAANYRDLILGRHGGRPRASTKTYRRVLAILVLQNRVSDIGTFLGEKLHDGLFPFDRTEGRAIAEKCFESLDWEDEDMECFNSTEPKV